MGSIDNIDRIIDWIDDLHAYALKAAMPTRMSLIITDSVSSGGEPLLSALS
jgi:hypothetical protein